MLKYRQWVNVLWCLVLFTTVCNCEVLIFENHWSCKVVLCYLTNKTLFFSVRCIKTINNVFIRFSSFRLPEWFKASNPGLSSFPRLYFPSADVRRRRRRGELEDEPKMKLRLSAAQFVVFIRIHFFFPEAYQSLQVWAAAFHQSAFRKLHCFKLLLLYVLKRERFDQLITETWRSCINGKDVLVIVISAQRKSCVTYFICLI